MSITFHPGLRDPRGTWTFVECVEGLNVNNRNAVDLAHALGLSIEDGCLEPVPVGEFVNRCTNFLRSRLGRPDPAIEPYESHGDLGAAVIDCGRGEGYLQLKVMQLLELARTGEAHGATHVYGA